MRYQYLIKSSNLLQLLFSGLLYTLGAGISHYLGNNVKLVTLLTGLLILWSILLAFSWLSEFFRLPLTPLKPNETPRFRERFRMTLLHAALAALTLAGALVISLLVVGNLNVSSGMIILLIAVALLVYTIPPFQLVTTGFGEIFLAAVMTFLIPAFSYFLQSENFHRLLSFTAIPLLFILIDFFLVRDFSTFASDVKYQRATLVTRISWQKTVPLHHLLLLAAYFLFTFSPFLGIPWGLVWPIIVSFPLGLIQIIWLHRISLGAKPYWKFINTLAAVTFGMAVYLISLSLWLR